MRLFVALWPTPAVRVALGARRDAVAWPAGSSVVADERLHLTLHFIGAVPRTLWPRLLPALQVPCPPPFALELGAVEAWPHGLVVLRALAVPEPLRALHAAMAAALAGLGLRVEARPFRPHVTLARRAAGARLPPADEPLRWRAGGYALVNSEPTGYRVLARYGARGVTLAAAPRTATARSRPAPAPTPG
ncbi:MAG TPA: RNA 2',3'-cyclic phosphodiesterase [Burkholderiaceae bacterium]|nr:RNA 2',3'-cyclic phosphodiesterase [Burkholderiaceae bacterium]